MTNCPPDQHHDALALEGERAARQRREEFVNTLTHAAGCALGLAGVVWLLATVLQDGARRQVVACAIYGVALVSVYLASALSHAFHLSPWRRPLRMLDQACIFLLIAGTFTPPALTYLSSGMWWLVPAAMWVIALGGFISKAFFAHQVEAVTTRLHLVLGWMPVLAVKPLATFAPLGMLLWLLAGGICYTVGAVFLTRDHYPYFHAVWHLLVIAGSTCHYVAIWLYCTSAAV